MTFESPVPNPLTQFTLWFSEACNLSEIKDPNACCLSTIDENGFPDGRMVLLKGFDDLGFLFFTNSLSRKGRALAKIPRASLTFFWDPLQRQIRIQGEVAQIPPQQSDEYFSKRPRTSQLGAWASKQSEVLKSRSDLDEHLKEYSAKFAEKSVPRPPHWNGYRLSPNRIEFWQEQEFRLHDRLLYTKDKSGKWQTARLYP